MCQSLPLHHRTRRRRSKGKKDEDHELLDLAMNTASEEEEEQVLFTELKEHWRYDDRVRIHGCARLCCAYR